MAIISPGAITPSRVQGGGGESGPSIGPLIVAPWTYGTQNLNILDVNWSVQMAATGEVAESLLVELLDGMTVLDSDTLTTGIGLGANPTGTFSTVDGIDGIDPRNLSIRATASATGLPDRIGVGVALPAFIRMPLADVTSTGIQINPSVLTSGLDTTFYTVDAGSNFIANGTPVTPAVGARQIATYAIRDAEITEYDFRACEIAAVIGAFPTSNINYAFETLVFRDNPLLAAIDPFLTRDWSAVDLVSIVFCNFPQDRIEAYLDKADADGATNGIFYAIGNPGALTIDDNYPAAVNLRAKGWTVVIKAGLPFSITVDTTQTGSASNRIELPVSGTGSFLVDLGDSSAELLTDPVSINHDYASGGVYTINISSTADTDRLTVAFNNTGDRQKLTSISSWGDIVWSSFENGFYGCGNLTSIPLSSPDLSVAANLNSSLRDTIGLNPDLSSWDVENIITALNMLDGSGLSTVNYDALLVAWSGQSVQSGVGFGAVNAFYTNQAARDVLTDPPNSWVITDSGLIRDLADPTVGTPIVQAQALNVLTLRTSVTNNDAETVDLDAELLRDGIAFDTATLSATTGQTVDFDFASLDALNGLTPYSYSLRVTATSAAPNLNDSNAVTGGGITPFQVLPAFTTAGVGSITPSIVTSGAFAPIQTNDNGSSWQANGSTYAAPGISQVYHATIGALTQIDWSACELTVIATGWGAIAAAVTSIIVSGNSGLGSFSSFNDLDYGALTGVTAFDGDDCNLNQAEVEAHLTALNNDLVSNSTLSYIGNPGALSVDPAFAPKVALEGRSCTVNLGAAGLDVTWLGAPSLSAQADNVVSVSYDVQFNTAVTNYDLILENQDTVQIGTVSGTNPSTVTPTTITVPNVTIVNGVIPQIITARIDAGANGDNTKPDTDQPVGLCLRIRTTFSGTMGGPLIDFSTDPNFTIISTEDGGSTWVAFDRNVSNDGTDKQMYWFASANETGVRDIGHNQAGGGTEFQVGSYGTSQWEEFTIANWNLTSLDLSGLAGTTTGTRVNLVGNNLTAIDLLPIENCIEVNRTQCRNNDIATLTLGNYFRDNINNRDFEFNNNELPVATIDQIILDTHASAPNNTDASASKQLSLEGQTPSAPPTGTVQQPAVDGAPANAGEAIWELLNGNASGINGVKIYATITTD